MHTHARTHARTRARTHARMHARAHAHTATHRRVPHHFVERQQLTARRKCIEAVAQGGPGTRLAILLDWSEKLCLEPQNSSLRAIIGRSECSSWCVCFAAPMGCAAKLTLVSVRNLRMMCRTPMRCCGRSRLSSLSVARLSARPCLSSTFGRTVVRDTSNALRGSCISRILFAL